MKTCFTKIAVVLLFFSAYLPAYGGEVVFVEDGRAVCTIVVGEDDGLSLALTMERSDVSLRVPGGNIRVAAQAFADHMHDMAWIGDSRFQMRVVDDIREARTPYRVLIGTAAIEEYGMHEEAARHPHWSYTYRTVGNDLLIFGSSSKGAANGVYGFLQNELGVRWFGPGELFRVMPESDTISVGRVERRDDPDFTGRFSAMTQYDNPAGVWANRMRLAEPGRGEAAPFYNHSHSFHKMFPPAEYGDRPELYAMRGGRRHMGPGAFGLCYSNPEVIELAARKAKDYFSGGGHRHSFSLGIHDGSAYCECDECVKLQPERTFRGRRVASDMYFHFVNEVARRVAEEYPDRYLGLIAYNDVTVPPLGEVEDNVFAVIVSDVSEYYDPGFREQDMGLVRAWQEKGINMGMYYYTGLAKLVPAYFPRMLAEELKDRRERGYVVMYTEAHPGWPWTGPMHYVQGRLWWDVDLNVDELLEEYFTGLYGPAAPYVAELYELFEEIHTRPRAGGFLYEHYNFLQFRPYGAEDLARMRELISSAHGAIERLSVGRMARENHESRRLAYITKSLRLFLDMFEGVVLARELEAVEIAPGDAAAMEVLHKVDRMGELMERHVQVYREAIITDTTHSNRFLNDTATPVRNAWTRYLSGVQGGALAELQGIAGALGPAAASAVQERVAEYTREPASRALFAVKAGEAEFGENLVPNPGFEEVDDDGRAEGWGMTPFRDREEAYVIDTVEHEELTERFGRRSGRMKGITRNAYYLHHVRGIEEGQPYLFEVDAKLLLPGDRRDLLSGEVFVRVDWRGPDVGVIRGEHQFEMHLQELNQWERLRTAAIAPEGADTARVFLRASNMRGEEEAWFDNVSVRKITHR